MPRVSYYDADKGWYDNTDGYYVDEPVSETNLGFDGPLTKDKAPTLAKAPACRHCGGPTRFHSTAGDWTWFRCFNVDCPVQDGENYSLTVVKPGGPPCSDPRPDPRTHPEYWTE